MAYEHKVITVKKIVNQLLPKKMFSSDKIQEFIQMYFILDSQGNRYQYMGSSVADSKVSKTDEILILASPGDKLKLMCVQVKTGALDLERTNKVLEVSEVKE